MLYALNLHSITYKRISKLEKEKNILVVKHAKQTDKQINKEPAHPSKSPKVPPSEKSCITLNETTPEICVYKQMEMIGNWRVKLGVTCSNLAY